MHDRAKEGLDRWHESLDRWTRRGNPLGARRAEGYVAEAKRRLGEAREPMDFQDALVKKYKRAADFPWISVPDDPPHFSY